MRKRQHHKPENAIRHCRKALQFSQVDVARLLGVSTSYFNMMENGKRPMPAHLLLKLIALAKTADAHTSIHSLSRQVHDRQQQECTDYLQKTKS